MTWSFRGDSQRAGFFSLLYGKRANVPIRNSHLLDIVPLREDASINQES